MNSIMKQLRNKQIFSSMGLSLMALSFQAHAQDSTKANNVQNVAAGLAMASATVAAGSLIQDKHVIRAGTKTFDAQDIKNKGVVQIAREVPVGAHVELAWRLSPAETYRVQAAELAQQSSLFLNSNQRDLVVAGQKAESELSSLKANKRVGILPKPELVKGSFVEGEAETYFAKQLRIGLYHDRTLEAVSVLDRETAALSKSVRTTASRAGLMAVGLAAIAGIAHSVDRNQSTRLQAQIDDLQIADIQTASAPAEHNDRKE